MESGKVERAKANRQGAHRNELTHAVPQRRRNADGRVHIGTGTPEVAAGWHCRGRDIVGTAIRGSGGFLGREVARCLRGNNRVG
jgi:hypothetical protein